MEGPDGKIGHAELQIGDSVVMLSDPFPQGSTHPPSELGGTSASVFLYVEDVDAARDLHDSAAHAINVILVQAGAARLLQERDPAAARDALSTIEEVAREAIGEIDHLVRRRPARKGARLPAQTRADGSPRGA